jgi:hypothetical protein
MWTRCDVRCRKEDMISYKSVSFTFMTSVIIDYNLQIICSKHFQYIIEVNATRV